MIIGISYCIIPYVISVTTQFVKTSQENELNTMFRLVIIMLNLIVIANAYIINNITASITVRNKTIAKHLYPIFSEQRKLKRSIKLKIDSWIARLNEEFIGFYYFNFSQFTKLAFYQYILVVSTCYMLVNDFV